MNEALDLNLEMARQMRQGFVSHGIASLVVARVAEFGESGRWPEDVTPETLGMALRRLMVNAPDEDAFANLERGYRAEKPSLNMAALAADLPRLAQRLRLRPSLFSVTRSRGVGRTRCRIFARPTGRSAITADGIPPLPSNLCTRRPNG